MALRNKLGHSATELAAQLPASIGQHLRWTGELHVPARPMYYREFLDQVSRRGAIPPECAAEQARAVIEVLQEVLTPKSRAIMESRLIGEFRVLLDSPNRIRAGWDL